MENIDEEEGEIRKETVLNNEAEEDCEIVDESIEETLRDFNPIPEPPPAPIQRIYFTN